MDVRAVNEPDDQRPGLLRIPAPVAAPRVIGPHGSQDDAERQQGESHHDRLVPQLVDRLQVRKRRKHAGPAAPPFGPLLQQIHDPQPPGHRKGGVAGQRDRHVDVDPIAVQRRHQRLRGLVPVRQQRGGSHGDEADPHHEGPDHLDAVPELEHHVAQNDRPGDVRHGLELVGPGGERATQLQALVGPGPQREGVDHPPEDRDDRGHLADLRRPGAIAVGHPRRGMAGRGQLHAGPLRQDVPHVERQRGEVEPKRHIEQEQRPKHGSLREA